MAGEAASSTDLTALRLRSWWSTRTAQTPHSSGLGCGPRTATGLLLRLHFYRLSDHGFELAFTVHQYIGTCFVIHFAFL